MIFDGFQPFMISCIILLQYLFDSVHRHHEWGDHSKPGLWLLVLMWDSRMLRQWPPFFGHRVSAFINRWTSNNIPETCVVQKRCDSPSLGWWKCHRCWLIMHALSRSERLSAWHFRALEATRNLVTYSLWDTLSLVWRDFPTGKVHWGLRSGELYPG